MEKYFLAQINIAKFRAELDAPLMHGFTSRIDEINALADKAPGFVWRFQTEEGDATAVRPFEDKLLLVNMSVWEDIESFKKFVYQTAHVELLRDKQQWIAAPIKPHLAMWWCAQGMHPTLEDGMARLQRLKTQGDSAQAFGFNAPFAPPSSP